MDGASSSFVAGHRRRCQVIDYLHGWSSFARAGRTKKAYSPLLCVVHLYLICISIFFPSVCLSKSYLKISSTCQIHKELINCFRPSPKFERSWLQSFSNQNSNFELLNFLNFFRVFAPPKFLSVLRHCLNWCMKHCNFQFFFVWSRTLFTAALFSKVFFISFIRSLTCINVSIYSMEHTAPLITV